MSKKVQVTNAFRLGGERYFAGDICKDAAAEHALSNGYGKPAPVEKSDAPSNKSAKAPSSKGK